MNSPKNFSNKICLSVTGPYNECQSKLEEINRLKIKTAAVFLSYLFKKQRDNLYSLLLKSSLQSIPFVHLRGDTDKKDIKFFAENFGTKYFNIHEAEFKILDKWKGLWNRLYLEMDYDSEIPKNVKAQKIGGFCVDLSHFKAALALGSDEAYYIFTKKHDIKIACNHLNGYSPANVCDLHTIASLKDFDYLTTLPKYVFGDVIALEVRNSIKEQIQFKKYLVGLLNKYFDYSRQ